MKNKPLIKCNAWLTAFVIMLTILVGGCVSSDSQKDSSNIEAARNLKNRKSPTITDFTIPSTSSSLTVPISSLSATHTSPITGYRVIESSTKPSAVDVRWSATAPTSYLASSAGAKMLYAYAKDGEGNVSAGVGRSVLITLPGLVLPTISVFNIPSSSSSLTVLISNLSATHTSPITGYMVNESPTKPSALDSRWNATAPTSYLASSAGAKTLYAYAKDDAGNVSAGVSRSVLITLPSLVLPTISQFNIPSTSSSLTVPITSFTASGSSIVAYAVSENSATPSIDSTRWVTSVPTSYTATSEGTKVLYAWVKDAANNISPSVSRTVNITPTISVQIANWYVSPTGNDTNSGSMTSPFATINKAWSVAQPGQIIYMRGGTYRFNSAQTLSGKSGLAGKHIKIFAYPGEKPIITKDPAYTGLYGIYINGANYIHLKGLEIMGFEQIRSTSFFYGIIARNTNNSIFEQLDVHHNGFGLAIGDDSSGNLILNSDSHHNSDPITNVEGNIAWGGSDGFTIRSSNPTAVNTMRGCRSWWNSDDGTDLWSTNGLVIMENNWHFWNGYKRGTFETGGDGNGFKVGPLASGVSYSGQVKRILRNNLSFENRNHGYDQNNLQAVVQLENNTAYGNGSVGFSFIFHSQPHKLKNNISYMNVFREINGQSTWDHTYNSWNRTTLPINSDFQSVSSLGADGPRKTDGSLPDLKFMKLSDTSKYINTATPIPTATIHNTSIPGIPYLGTAPDLGAYELK